MNIYLTSTQSIFSIVNNYRHNICIKYISYIKLLMEFVSSIRLRDIFLDNGNWYKLFLKYHKLIRIGIIINVLKILVCRTSFLGYHHYICPKCKKSIKVPHTCKSRFCSSCGKKATDNWIKTRFNTLPKTTWQHITFTMPEEFWGFFWFNRSLMNKVPAIAANIIKRLSKQKGFSPGIFLAMHTFGRDLKRNIHIHLSTTIGGISPSHDSWIKNCYFHHDKLKSMWRYEIISLLRKEFKKGNFKLPCHLKHIKTYNTFCSWTSQFYNKKWVVHLSKHSDDTKSNVEYLGRYVKRPPIGETRILNYDGNSVTYKYLDHHTNSQKVMHLPVLEFISRLICHIPDKNFRVFRYYGFLSNRLSGKLLPIVYKLLNIKNIIKTKVYTSWQNMIKNTFNYDPLKCSICNIQMSLISIQLPRAAPLISKHEEIVNGNFKLI